LISVTAALLAMSHPFLGVMFRLIRIKLMTERTSVIGSTEYGNSGMTWKDVEAEAV
jgi:hypothetical protein